MNEIIQTLWVLWFGNICANTCTRPKKLRDECGEWEEFEECEEFDECDECEELEEFSSTAEQVVSMKVPEAPLHWACRNVEGVYRKPEPTEVWGMCFGIFNNYFFIFDLDEIIILFTIFFNCFASSSNSICEG